MRVIGNPFGEFRGKMGGTVFSRNKSGAIARVYVKPTNRNSQRQQNIRSIFGSVSKQFANLTEVQKESWNGFAADGSRFQPLQGLNQGQYSGFQAFQALRGVVAQHLTNFLDVLPTAVGFSVTGSPLVASVTPPTTMLRGTLVGEDGSGGEANVIEPQVSLDTCICGSDECHFNIKLSEGMYFPETAKDLIDGSGQSVGFAIYMSSIISDAGIRPKKFLYQKIVSTQVLSMTAISAGVESIIPFIIPVHLEDYSDLREGSRRFTLFMVGENGNVKNCGSVVGQFVASDIAT